jgi:tripartite-type tricarboxylate transporter receptor subunit TctC
VTRTALLAALAAVALPALPGPAAADFPEGPVTFLVPWPPGDLEDVLTRMIAEDFAARYGVEASVENLPGGGNGPFPGAVKVATAPPDGAMIGSFVVDVPVIGPSLGIPELTAETFEPVGIFFTYPFVIAATKASGITDIAGLARIGASEPVTLGHFGRDLLPTMATFAMADKLGMQWGADRPYDIVDCAVVASGEVMVINTTMQLIQGCTDQLTILAAITENRIPILPDVPTLREIDPVLEISLWNGLFVPKGTSAETREKIAAIARTTMESDRAREVGSTTGAPIFWKDAAETAVQIENDRRLFEEIAALVMR